LTYLLSICVVLIVPSCLLALRQRARIQRVALATALVFISVIGWGWSATVTAHGWWTFGGQHITGWRPLPHLLIEEVIFYPAGGALCILLYLAFARRPVRPRPDIYVVFLILGTALFATLGLSHAGQRPYYLYSQLIVYNLLVCGMLSPAVAHRIDLRGFIVTTLLMASVGYIWDHVAFVGTWWEYHAITQLHLGLVPFDDVDFFMFAPAAAISVYEFAGTVAVSEATQPNRVQLRAVMGGLIASVQSSQRGVLKTGHSARSFVPPIRTRTSVRRRFHALEDSRQPKGPICDPRPE